MPLPRPFRSKARYPVPARPRLAGAQCSLAFPTAILLGLALAPLPASSQAGTGAGEPVWAIRVARVPLPTSPLRLAGPARGGEYLGAVGTRAAWLGAETGEGEVWVHPLKVVRQLSLAFRIPEYPEPIPAAQVARQVEAGPGHATVTYSHAAFVVKEHILAPRNAPGILILLEADPVVQLEIEVEFQPVLQYAWPAGFGGQYLFWDSGNRAFVLSESLREHNAVVGSPWATEASAHPAHRLADAPSVFVIPVDPERARQEYIPIVVAGGIAPRDQVLAAYREMLEQAPDLAREIGEWAEGLRREGLRMGAPPQVAGGSGAAPGASLPTSRASPASVSDQASERLPADSGPELAALALEWAKVNLAEQRVCNPDLGCGFVAGWGPSGTSFRPGFGWFFGGDAAINSLAMDATGQWEDVAEALRFLARYQRQDGKIPHEISQSAGHIPWFESYPYAYYHADTTPFWMLALWHYWRASGDQGLVQELWPAYLKAHRWCLSVETDGDGIIENTTGGLGAIEVGGLGEGLHQDIYLAAVWITALQGTVEMAAALGEPSLAAEAGALFQKARDSLNREYWRAQEGHHAFGILQGGGTNNNLTAWPGTALSFGLLDAEQAEGTLRHLAGDAISASWGARLLSTASPLYDPLHYNNGAVWPFMTGFVAWGQYRYRRPWAGYPLLHALWRLNRDWSLGRHPENLSGAFYQTMDATVPHQFFATSMLVTPLARGLLGWDPDAPRRRARLAPQPPADWSELSVQNLRVGGTAVSMAYRRGPGQVEVELSAAGPEVELTYLQPLPPGAREVRVEGGAGPVRATPREGPHDLQHEVTFRLSGSGAPVRLRFAWEGGLEVLPVVPAHLTPGSPSGGVRVLDFTRDGEGWALTLEGDGGGRGEVFLRGEAVRSDQGVLTRSPSLADGYLLAVDFPAGAQRVVRTVRLSPAR